jgi:hypothetical protein
MTRDARHFSYEEISKTREIIEKTIKGQVNLACYKHPKKLPILRVVFLKIIIEMFLLSRQTVLTIRFTVLLQVVTRCIKDYEIGQNDAR